jgi:hypothetical protein
METIMLYLGNFFGYNWIGYIILLVGGFLIGYYFKPLSKPQKE